MIITNNKKQLVLPEPGDVFKTVLNIDGTPKLIIVRVEKAEDSEDCSGCVFESMCTTGNKTVYVCYGPDRYDGISIKIVPVKQENTSEA